MISCFPISTVLFLVKKIAKGGIKIVKLQILLYIIKERGIMFDVLNGGYIYVKVLVRIKVDGGYINSYLLGPLEVI